MGNFHTLGTLQGATNYIMSQYGLASGLKLLFPGIVHKSQTLEICEAHRTCKHMTNFFFCLRLQADQPGLSIASYVISGSWLE